MCFDLQYTLMPVVDDLSSYMSDFNPIKYFKILGQLWILIIIVYLTNGSSVIYWNDFKK